MLGARWRSSDDQGFTLLELVVVMIILGILATIAIAVFLGQREKAQRSSAISSVRNTSTLAEAIRLDDPQYPSDPRDFEAEGGGGFEFTDDPSTSPTHVSIATFDDDETLVLAARGGGQCVWLRTTIRGQQDRGRFDVTDECHAATLEEERPNGW